MSKIAQPPFKDFIKPFTDSLLRIKRRLFFLENLQEQLESKTAGDTFQIKNDIVWQMVIDTYDMLVIVLASLCRSWLSAADYSVA